MPRRVVLHPAADIWPQLFGQLRRKQLHPFRSVGSGERVAVSTPGDLLLHIRSDDMGLSLSWPRS